VVLFGSITQPGRFRPDSDIDVAVAYDFATIEGVAAESAFWRALEQALQRNVDVRPLRDIIAEIATSQGETLYEREVSGLEE
jgi:predicted nucleotidyltransferase